MLGSAAGAALENIQCRLNATSDLCLMLACAFDEGVGEKDGEVIGTFYALAYAIEDQVKAISAVVLGRAEVGAS